MGHGGCLRRNCVRILCSGAEGATVIRGVGVRVNFFNYNGAWFRVSGRDFLLPDASSNYFEIGSVQQAHERPVDVACQM